MTDVQSNHKRVVLQCLQWIGGRHLPYLLSSKGLKRGNGPGWLQSTSAGDSKGYFTTWRRSCVLTLQPIDRIFVWHQRRWTTSCQWLVQISSDRTPKYIMIFITFHWFITILYVKRPTQTSRKIIKIETSLCLNFPRGNVGAVHSVSASGVATLIAFNGFEFCCVHTASAKQNFRVWCSQALRVFSQV